ncbi:MAG: helix-turn-helix domain-containing protein [Anaerolineales bacterium]
MDMAEQKFDIRQKIGQRLARLMATSMETDGALAKYLGVSRQQVIKLRQGKVDPRASQIVKLAQRFGVDPGFFIEDEPLRIEEEIIENIRVSPS